MTVKLAGYGAQIRMRAKYTTDVWFERDEPDHLTTLIYWTVIARKNNNNDNNIISTSRSKRTIDTWLKVVTEHQIIDVSMDESRWRRCRAARSERREIGKRASMSTSYGGSHYSIIHMSSTFRTCWLHQLRRMWRLRDTMWTSLSKHDMSNHDMGLVIIESEEELKVPCHSSISISSWEWFRYLVRLIKREISKANQNQIDNE